MGASFLTRLARPRPDPGGGAAAAYGAEVALALLLKVLRLEMARPQTTRSQSEFWAGKLGEAASRRRTLASLRQADVEAYLAMAGGGFQRNTHLVEEATRCPWRIMAEAISALEAVEQAGEHCRAHLVADLLVAAELLAGAWQGAHHIAAANLPLLPPDRQREWAARLAETSHRGLEATLRVRSRLLARRSESAKTNDPGGG